MRPSAFTDGNAGAWKLPRATHPVGRFNEAVGFHRRKLHLLPASGRSEAYPVGRFNEAVGFHRRKRTKFTAGPRLQ